MTTIIAAKIQLQEQAEQAIHELELAGFARRNITSFYVNPPGQHATYPIGGDRFESPGAKESGEGAVKGAAVAAAAGAVLGASLSPAGAVIGGLIGAHAGSLIGTLSSTKENGEFEHDGGSIAKDGSGDNNEMPLRRAGMVIAVGIKDEGGEAKAIHILRGCGADGLEKADGEISDGEWRDFDPLSAPNYL